MTRQNFKLSRARNLEYLTNGLSQTSAVILHAGTTQDITGWQTWLDYFADQGVFALSFGRSGYAASTAMPGRITIDVANDIAELATTLGITKFVNIGLSGGGQRLQSKVQLLSRWGANHELLHSIRFIQLTVMRT
jgi:pimeloyl-ACP methyl ester carboxylesterase